jgi:hypothetical protein
MIRKFLLLVLLAIATTAAILAMQSRDEIARYRAIREM